MGKVVSLSAKVSGSSKVSTGSKRKSLKRLLPWMLLGIALGVTLLRDAGARWPLILLGAFVLVVCFQGLRGARGGPKPPLKPIWAFPFGVFGGVFSALFGTGGPIYTIYLSRRLDALEQFHPLLYERVIAGIVPTGGLGREGAVKNFFEDYLEARPELADVTRLSLEILEINRRMRAA